MFRSERSGDLLSKKGNLMKEILSCGLGYHHIKKVNMTNYCLNRHARDLSHDVAPLPDFEVTKYAY